MAGGEPYIGLRSHDVDDRWCRFHGRDRESRDLSVLWRSNRLLVLYGHSGVGKTSLIQAGVIPRLDKETADALPVARISHSFAFPTADPPLHNPYDFALLSSWSPNDSPASLVGLSLTDFLSRREVRTDQYGDPVPVLMAIDQFEEFFSDFPYRQPYLDQFIDHLADAVENVPNLRLLISIREEFLAKLIPYETRLAGYPRARFQVLPLIRDAALKAVTGPLAGTGRSFAPGVAEKLVDDLRTVETTSQVGKTTKVTVESVEPAQLQVACTVLWRALPQEDTTITEEHLHHHGDVRTVAEFCTRMVTEVAGEQQISERSLYEWLASTFITKHGSRDTAYEGVSETSGMPNPVARALGDRGILEFKQRFGLRWYELQHDRLIDRIHLASSLRSEQTVSETGPADYLRGAGSALASAEFELAEKHAKQAIRMCSDHNVRAQAEAEFFLGNIAIQRDQLDLAEKHYLRAEEHFDMLQDQAAVEQLLEIRGRLLSARGRYTDAAVELQRAVDRHRDNLAIKVELARAFWFSGELLAAAAVLGGVLTIAPGDTEALAERGQILVERNDPTSALEDLDHLLRLRPEIGHRPEVRAARALALARAQPGRLGEAVAEADAAVEEAPGSGPVLLRASGVTRAAGESSRADELLRRAGDARDPALLDHQLVELRRLLAEAA